MATLDFLKDSINVYYTGLDYRSFPLHETKQRIKLDKYSQIIYLKTLALLVDHVAIPPAFLVYGMGQEKQDETFIKSVLELFESRSFITAVHGSMNSPIDFYEYKIQFGDKDEKKIFLSKENEAKKFFKNIPLLHRNIPIMSGAFKKFFIDNLTKISEKTVPLNTKEKIQLQIKHAESKGEVELSRMTVISILERLGLNRRQFRACYYAMNSAYYLSGALTYNSDIACLNVEEFSVFGNMLFEQSENKIVIGYDPILFFNVLRCHHVTSEEIFWLDALQLEKLKNDIRFRIFIQQYREFSYLIQSTADILKGWSKNQILQLKEDMLIEIEKQFQSGKSHLKKISVREDIGTGFFTTVLGIVLGFALAGPLGAAAGGAVGGSVGFYGPISKVFRMSLAEKIAIKLDKKQLAFFLYIEFLRMKLEEFSEERRQEQRRMGRLIV